MHPLLKTGEAAQLLGVSRQHVVDLCERGDLPYVRVGSHRRVLMRGVEELVGPPLTREQEKSLWLHRALMSPLLSDPDTVLGTARDNLERWRSKHRAGGMSARYLTRWEKVLDAGLDPVVEVLISLRPEAHELRQNSPFAGVLSEDTRQQVLRSFTAHWAREHQSHAA